MTVFFLVSSRASTATVSRVHKAFPANVLCNAIAPELCSKSASRCCLHGWLAASTTVITQHICKAQRLNGMPSPSNTQKHMDTTDLFTAKLSTNTCWLFWKLRIRHALLHLAFYACLMKYWHFSNTIFLQEKEVLSYNCNSLKYRPKYLHGSLA